ncbi:MAG: 30S ribosomal protein S15 [Candidatus Methylacidiphilales bacterium]|nr:30S ribosomal protein S15 [Candidatus Methylacidiphilales bacterium]
MSKAETTTIIAETRLHEGDTGSADAQVAILTHRINHLTDHLKTAVKDHSSRRGLIRMVSKRRRLLDYLSRTDKGRYEGVIKKLSIRK